MSIPSWAASILAQLPPPTAPPPAPATTAPVTTSPAEQAVGFAMLLAIPVAIVIAWRAGVFRRRSINGPNRVAGDEPLAVLWVLALLAIFSWFGSIVVVSAVTHVNLSTSQPATAPAEVKLSPSEMVAYSAIGTAAGLLTLLGATFLVRRSLFDRIGLMLRHIPAAVQQGLVAAVIIVPLTFGSSIATEHFWSAIGYHHPSEHELLKALGDVDDPRIKLLVIVSAVVLAPAFEELLFRGFIQTALLGSIWRMFTPRPSIVPPPASLPWMPVAPPPPPTPQPPLQPQQLDAGVVQYATPQTESAFELRREAPRAWMRWTAVIITSLAFAAVHGELWLMPPIFFLSLCMGYAYERAGKVWVTMLVHATFNLTSTILFLTFR
jgi:membrane protease YdiL (CAAX protease family)